ncbi:histidine phosphatase family protein [Synechococcus sp. HK01-R]|uniref:histidine phosphatase family protein n=1 Tax=Synechococcus sp. HK01-R TaxID=2751171 RepID=UPI0016276F4E|nr:histidine phosphatase family protein [Synechococcus sp. HK01-R]QNG26358.1 histidine phosphatase family protein [Synechococcus sp. HK01-R]
MTSDRQIWLLRHGATEWAKNGRHTGSTDLPLLPEGEEEARRLAPVLKAQPFAAVFTSPLQRARRTCELGGLGEQAQVMDELLEWDYGDYEGITTPEIRKTVPGWTVWSHGCPNGEDAEAVQKRCEITIQRALEVSGPGDVALFAHGHLLRALAGTWLGLGAVGGSLLKLGTGSIGVLGFERENRAIVRWNAPADGRF